MRKYWKIAAASALSAMMLVGCGGVKVNTSLSDTYLMTVAGGELLRSEAMIVAMNYKCGYEKYNIDVSGPMFWEAESRDGRTYEDIVKNDVIWNELAALTALNAMAERDGIFLSDEEEMAAEEAGRAYFQELTQEERRYTGASEKAAISLMEKYKTAEKEIALCTQGEDWEISDEETRVMELQVIYVTDEGTANQAYERVMSGEDFTTVAQELSQDPQIAYTVSRGEWNAALENAVFSLETGEISPVVKAGQDFYIVQCIHDFDEALSQENRGSILENRLYQAWKEQVQSYIGENPVKRNQNVWEHIELDYVQGVNNDRFFDIYREYLGEQSGSLS